MKNWKFEPEDDYAGSADEVWFYVLMLLATWCAIFWLCF
jgi:hypothetical protein